MGHYAIKMGHLTMYREFRFTVLIYSINTNEIRKKAKEAINYLSHLSSRQ